MSIYQNSTKALIEVIESHSNLFSVEDWTELSALNSNLPEDEDEVEEVLENWLRHLSRSQILQAYKQELAFIIANPDTSLDKSIGIGNTKGVGGSQSPTNPNQSSQPAKELIDNAIKRNSPLSDNKKSH
jgi:hypothetical protein